MEITRPSRPRGRPRKDPAAPLQDRQIAVAARRVKNRALLDFRHHEFPSERLFDEMWAAAPINVFLQSPEKIADWALKRDRELRNEIMLFGVAKVLQILRLRSDCATVRALTNYVKKNRAAGIKNTKKVIDASKQFGRIVEMLDGFLVDGKILGDCTKGDLLRAAVDAEQRAGTAIMHAQFYRLLAAMLPEHGVTVRQANNRKEIVGLLTTTFRESA